MSRIERAAEPFPIFELQFLFIDWRVITLSMMTTTLALRQYHLYLVLANMAARAVRQMWERIY
jgi:hypothetical protein